MDKQELFDTVKEGLGEFRKEVSTEIKTSVEKALEPVSETLKKVSERVEAIEKLPASRLGFNVNSIPTHYKGYDLRKQLARGRNLAAQNPRLFPIFGNDEKAEEYSKWLISFIKARTRNDLEAMADLKEFYTKTNQLQEGTAGEGGYLVPDEFTWDIVGLARNRSFALDSCSVINMKTDQMYLPSEATLAAVAWTAEEGGTTAGEPTFGQVSLAAKRLDGYARVTNELLNDSAMDIVGMLTEQFGYAVALELDNQVLNGTGDPVSGVLTSAVGSDIKLASGLTNFSSISADYLSSAIYSLESGYVNGSKFIINRIGLHYIRTLKDSQNRPIFADIAGRVPGTIYEYPYFMSEKITNTSAAETCMAAFGNFKYFYIGRRLGVGALDVDPYGGFTTYTTRFRLVTRWALAIGNSKAFARILTATS